MPNFELLTQEIMSLEPDFSDLTKSIMEYSELQDKVIAIQKGLFGMGKPKMSGANPNLINAYWQGPGHKPTIKVKPENMPDGYGPNPKTGQDEPKEQQTKPDSEQKEKKDKEVKQDLSQQPETKRKLEEAREALYKINDEMKQLNLPKDSQAYNEMKERRQVAFKNMLSAYDAELERMSGESYQAIKAKAQEMYQGRENKLNKQMQGSGPSQGKQSLSYEDATAIVEKYKGKTGLGEAEMKEKKRAQKVLVDNRKMQDAEDKQEAVRKAEEIETESKAKMEQYRKNLAKTFATDKSPYPKIGSLKFEKVEITPETRLKDLETSAMIRYSGVEGIENIQDIKNRNKDVIVAFRKQVGLTVAPKGSKIDYIRGTISIPPTPENKKKIEAMLKDNKNMEKNFIIEGGKLGENYKISVKSMPGIDWKIRDIPMQTMGDVVNSTINRYEKQQAEGKRVDWTFDMGDGNLITSNANDSGQGNVWLAAPQGGGKGVMMVNMVLQSLLSADSSIVQFQIMDPTGKLLSSIENRYPGAVEELKKRGMLIGDNMTDLNSGSPQEMEVNTVNFVDNFHKNYLDIYAKQDAILQTDTGGVARLGELNKQKDPNKRRQVPQQVIMVDEVQKLEEAILTNVKDKTKQEEALTKLASVISSQNTNGLKRGITFIGALQSGFQSEILQRATRTGGEIISFGGAGTKERSTFGNYIAKPARKISGDKSRVMRFNIGESGQDPNAFSPVTMGAGTTAIMQERFEKSLIDYLNLKIIRLPMEKTVSTVSAAALIPPSQHSGGPRNDDELRAEYLGKHYSPDDVIELNEEEALEWQKQRRKQQKQGIVK